MLKTLAEKYRRDLMESVVPFWMTHAVDSEHGGVFTCLDRDGAVYDTRKYIWLQGRAVWMFSRLYNDVDHKPEYLDIARGTIRFLQQHAFDPSGRMMFSLTRDGKPFFFQRKIYAAVFYMQGLVEYYRATGETDYLNQAVDMFDRIVAWRRNPSLLGRPVFSGAPKTRSLADVMVLALMAIELADCSDDPRYREYIRSAIDGIKAHYDPVRRILMENVLVDPDSAAEFHQWPDARFFNPGHSIEVAWFLIRMLDFFPNDDDLRLALDIIDGSLQFGWDAEYGGIRYFMDVDRRPTLQLESDMKLWWPHTEAIYALVLAYSKTHDDKWLRWLEKVDEYAYAHFADSQYGGWFGYCDRRGELTHSCKGGNYKGFYHVPRGLLFSWKCIDALSSGEIS